ncbi:hypothetical protein [Streptomyces lincolnensis]|uniref:hypothetical protein n=1 Tax=Streptomyces lincolnensis TaxID=1915 RepID=UPI00082D36D5|nr:hypothetical protein [Streptomyces lincolnensis]QMV09531.1 hypothetical protein GJU35_30340 [Streptomyces lincolnensis]
MGWERRRLWRWVVVVWVVLVAVAGGVTLWLDGSVEPPGPYRWEEAHPSEPRLPDGWETLCPSLMPEENADGSGICAYSVIR